jgi:hypothetical protein
MQLNRFTFELKTASADDRPIYITGNFNNWKTADPRFCMEQIADRHYKLDVVLPEKSPFVLIYKYIKGGWDDEEVDAYGNNRDNRSADIRQGHVFDSVPYYIPRDTLVPHRWTASLPSNSLLFRCGLCRAGFESVCLYMVLAYPLKNGCISFRLLYPVWWDVKG